MSIYAYIRISDDTKQKSDNQHHVITTYAKENNFVIENWQEFHLSGSKTSSKERGIDDLLSNLKRGDIILVADIARLGRDSVHQLLNTITTITTKGASIHFCYSKTIITPNHQNDIASIFMAIGEAFAAVKFSEERSQKSKAACERRAKAGLHNGRKAGAVVKSKLDDHVTFISSELDKGTSKTAIVALLAEKGVTVQRKTLYRWIDKRLSSKSINKKYLNLIKKEQKPVKQEKKKSQPEDEKLFKYKKGDKVKFSYFDASAPMWLRFGFDKYVNSGKILEQRWCGSAEYQMSVIDDDSRDTRTVSEKSIVLASDIPKISTPTWVYRLDSVGRNSCGIYVKYFPELEVLKQLCMSLGSDSTKEKQLDVTHHYNHHKFNNWLIIKAKLPRKNSINYKFYYEIALKKVTLKEVHELLDNWKAFEMMQKC